MKLLLIIIASILLAASVWFFGFRDSPEAVNTSTTNTAITNSQLSNLNDNRDQQIQVMLPITSSEAARLYVIALIDQDQQSPANTTKSVFYACDRTTVSATAGENTTWQISCWEKPDQLVEAVIDGNGQIVGSPEVKGTN